MKDGIRHGIEYDWRWDGILTAAEPWVNGKPHGIAKQWSQTGVLIGSYSMHHGTGIDLWWESLEYDGRLPFFLAEVHPMRDGKPHGFVWWLNEDQKSVFTEWHFVDGVKHGIFREWKDNGLRRDSPQYFVGGVKVRKRQYIRAAASDESLPPFREHDNLPTRLFPPEIQKHLLKRET